MAFARGGDSRFLCGACYSVKNEEIVNDPIGYEFVWSVVKNYLRSATKRNYRSQTLFRPYYQTDVPLKTLQVSLTGCFFAGYLAANKFLST